MMRSRAATAVGLLIALIGLIGASATTRIVFAIGVAIVIVGMMLLARDSREPDELERVLGRYVGR
jgi:hypothetical protein